MKKTLMLLSLTCLVLIVFGCGTTEDTEQDVIEEDVIPMGSIAGEVQSIDGVSIQVRILRAGELVQQVETEGDYEFTELEEGDYTIQISAKGYEDTELIATVVADQTVSLVNVELVAITEPVSHLQGVLADKESGNPLIGVIIQLTTEENEEFSTLTNNSGMFSFENLPIDQDFTLNIAHAGYEDSEILVQPLSEDQTYELTVELTKIPDPVSLGPSEGLVVGSIAPDFKLPDGNSVQHSLSDYTSDNNVVLVFYRGSW